MTHLKIVNFVFEARKESSAGVRKEPKSLSVIGGDVGQLLMLDVDKEGFWVERHIDRPICFVKVVHNEELDVSNRNKAALLCVLVGSCDNDVIDGVSVKKGKDKSYVVIGK